MNQVNVATLPRRQRLLSNQDIGETAGQVWNLLVEHDGLTLTALKKAIDAPADLVIAAIGWLAREDKLEFVSTGRSMKIRLR